MSQIARNLSDPVDGVFVGKRYLIHDRDPLFRAEFVNMLAEAGIQSVKLPPRSPNLNAHAERFVRTIKESCLDRLILFGEGSLRKTVREFVAHYHLERNHQGLGHQRSLREQPLRVPWTDPATPATGWDAGTTITAPRESLNTIGLISLPGITFRSRYLFSCDR